MGQLCATSESGKQSRMIDAQMKAAREDQNRQVKLLLLGPGDSGKSTLFTQMQLNYADPTRFKNNLHYSGMVRASVLEATRSLCLVLDLVVKDLSGLDIGAGIGGQFVAAPYGEDLQKFDRYRADLGNPDERVWASGGEGASTTGPPINMASIQVLIDVARANRQSFGNLAEFSGWITELNAMAVPEVFINHHKEKFFNLLTAFWEHELTRLAWRYRARFQVFDSFEYFCDKANLRRLFGSDYEPTKTDVLLARVRTTGIKEDVFKLDGVLFKIVDVGGQRSERRKWIQSFSGTTAIIYVTSVSEFDQTLFEDTYVSRQSESFALLKSIVNFKIFKDISIILMLNKVDLLYRKVIDYQRAKRNGDSVTLATFFDPKKVNLRGSDEKVTKEILNYTRQLYEREAGGVNLYTHYVTATDKRNFLKVFESVRAMVVAKALEDVMGVSQGKKQPRATPIEIPKLEGYMRKPDPGIKKSRLKKRPSMTSHKTKAGSRKHLLTQQGNNSSSQLSRANRKDRGRSPKKTKGSSRQYKHRDDVPSLGYHDF